MKKVEDNQEAKNQVEETLPAVADEVKTAELTELSADEEVASDSESKELSVEAEPSEIAEPSASESDKEDAKEEVDEAETKRKKSVKKKTVASEVMDWLRTICIGVIAGFLLVVFVIQRDNVYGDSMNPTLESGDVLSHRRSRHISRSTTAETSLS